MAENTTQPKKPKATDNPFDTSAVALDSFNKTVKKDVQEKTKQMLDSGTAPQEIFRFLLGAYGVSKEQMAQSQEQAGTTTESLLEDVMGLAETPVGTGKMAGPFQSFRQTGSFKRVERTEPLGFDDALKLILAQEDIQGKAGDIKSQQLENIKTILDIVPELQRVLTPQKGEELERGVGGELTTEGIKQQERAKKLAAMSVEREQQFAEATAAVDDFVGQFERSEQEIITVMGPRALESGLTGLGYRGAGRVAEMANQLPITTGFLRQIKQNANQMARNVEGGRVTDLDRQVYADVLASALDNASVTNSELLAVQLMTLDNKLTSEEKDLTIDPQLERFMRSSSPTLRRAAEIVNKVREQDGDKGVVKYDPVSRTWGRVFKDKSFIELGPTYGAQPGFNLDRNPAMEVNSKGAL